MDAKIIDRLRPLLERVINKYNSLTGHPMDFGSGDLLYPSELHFLEAVNENAPCSGQSLVGRLGVTKGAVSQLALRLENKKLISRARNEEYGKEILISLTKKGKIALTNHAAIHQAMDQSLAMKLKKEDPVLLAEFGRLLGVLENHLDECLLKFRDSKGDFRKLK
jgi:DNA-binding MarR family transcriptional regulator